MSWKFGGIYLKSDFNGDHALAISKLEIDKRPTDERVRFSTVTDSTFAETAVGIIGQVTLVHDNRLPYDHSYEADTLYLADEQLLLLSRDIENVVFFLDGITNSYGLAHFKSGRRIGHVSILSGEEIVLEGISWPDTNTYEANLLQWLENFGGFSFQHLWVTTEPWLYLFSETGF